MRRSTYKRVWLLMVRRGRRYLYRLLQNMWRPHHSHSWGRFILRHWSSAVCNYLAILDLIHLADANYRQAQNPSGSKIIQELLFSKRRLKSIPWNTTGPCSAKLRLSVFSTNKGSLSVWRGALLLGWGLLWTGARLPGPLLGRALLLLLAAPNLPLLKDSQRISWFTNSVW